MSVADLVPIACKQLTDTDSQSVTRSSSNFVTKLNDLFTKLRSSHTLQKQTNSSEAPSLDVLFDRGFTFPIEDFVKSPATKVLFNNSQAILQQICLKMWLECNNGLYQTEDLARCNAYLLEGWEFNRRFAPTVYLGIAPIFNEMDHNLSCGPLIREPQLSTIEVYQRYVLVMKRLIETNRLDHQLSLANVGNERGMTFLAIAIAEMHKSLDASPPCMGTVDCLRMKLDINRQLFEEALRDSQGKIQDIRIYRTICRKMDEFIKKYANIFEHRYEKQHIKRCHGDLKTTNLWVITDDSTPQLSAKAQRHLIPLDCVDFRPEFCHIDTLSDVAMLAIDLEMRLAMADCHKGRTRAQYLAEYFLATYLKVAGEEGDLQPILEYYMTEKAVVGTFMSISFDDLPSLGRKYLQVALAHSQKLEQYLTPGYARRATKPLTPNAYATTQRGSAGKFPHSGSR